MSTYGISSTVIVADASVVIDWIDGATDDALAGYVERRAAAIAPVTITEVLSGPSVRAAIEEALAAFDVLQLKVGYWERCGRLRQRMIKHGRKAGLGDVLTAQACLDHDLPLLARDRDFRAFVELAGLKLA